MTDAQRCYDALVAYFNTPEGYSEFGWHGDEMGWPPEQTAIEAMKRYLREKSSLLRPGASHEAQSDEVIALRAALRNMADAYARRVRSLCTPEEIEKEPWRCAEYIEAERLCKRPFKLLISNEQLSRMIAAEPDDAECEAGVLHPEAPTGASHEAAFKALAERIRKVSDKLLFRNTSNLWLCNELDSIAAAVAASAEAPGSKEKDG